MMTTETQKETVNITSGVDVEKVSKLYDTFREKEPSQESKETLHKFVKHPLIGELIEVSAALGKLDPIAANGSLFMVAFELGMLYQREVGGGK